MMTAKAEGPPLPLHDKEAGMTEQRFARAAPVAGLNSRTDGQGAFLFGFDRSAQSAP
jgi:hypothetical protein